MGWFYQRMTKQALIDELLEPYKGEHFDVKTLEHHLCGNQLWVLKDMSDVKGNGRNVVICLYLLDVAGPNNTGYKPMDESMGPFYYDCPVSWLDRAPVLNQKWRDEVLKRNC